MSKRNTYQPKNLQCANFSRSPASIKKKVLEDLDACRKPSVIGPLIGFLAHWLVMLVPTIRYAVKNQRSILILCFEIDEIGLTMTNYGNKKKSAPFIGQRFRQWFDRLELEGYIPLTSLY
jgi:hypothetical protein